MDEDTVLRLGDYCEHLLQSPDFQFLSAWFEQDAVGNMLATKPGDGTLREQVYARVCGHREFLTLMQQIISNRNELLAPPDHLDEIDNPGVHDIYKGITD